jgi:hypothetical protein
MNTSSQMSITKEIRHCGTLYITQVRIIIGKLPPKTFINTNFGTIGIHIPITLWIIRTFVHTVSTVIVSIPCDTHLNTFVGSVLSKVTLWTDLHASRGRRVSICFGRSCVLAFVSANT